MGGRYRKFRQRGESANSLHTHNTRTSLGWLQYLSNRKMIKIHLLIFFFYQLREKRGIVAPLALPVLNPPMIKPYRSTFLWDSFFLLSLPDSFTFFPSLFSGFLVFFWLSVSPSTPSLSPLSEHGTQQSDFRNTSPFSSQIIKTK